MRTLRGFALGALAPFIVMWLLPILSHAALPAGAIQYLPTLKAEQRALWPDMPLPSALPAQVEQETCAYLTHPKCWNPRAELKTSRENGVGFGQLTRAYRADGSVRFDAFTEVTAMDRSLRAWKWENRYDPTMQMRALVVKDRFNYRAFADSSDPPNTLAFALAAYNGGIGGVMSDRKLCQAIKGCNPAIWFGHVEKTSLKSTFKWQGYGASAFQINRDYVVNILQLRRPKYEGWM